MLAEPAAIAADPAPVRERRWLWVQLIVAWLPIGALFALLLMATHGIAFVPAVAAALRMTGVAGALGLVVMWFVARHPWPVPMRARFVLMHVGAALLFSLSWVVGNSVVESVWRWQLVLVIGPGWAAMLATGIWLYGMVAGVNYAQQASRRAALAQAHAARSRLAALRSQLQPHFLFNALHTVVQLIPLDPKAAQQAAEELAQLLRRTLDDDGDSVTLAEEWQRVQGYLAIEQRRLGARLVVHARLADDTLDAMLPSYAVQTLVENAVRHGAEPQVAPTTLTLRAVREGAVLVLEVHDDGASATPEQLHRPGGGLQRLRERLAVLHGEAASLQLTPTSPGVVARLRVPQTAARAADAAGGR